jgi:hypothetical protein
VEKFRQFLHQQKKLFGGNGSTVPAAEKNLGSVGDNTTSRTAILSDSDDMLFSPAVTSLDDDDESDQSIPASTSNMKRSRTTKRQDSALTRAMITCLCAFALGPVYTGSATPFLRISPGPFGEPGPLRPAPPLLLATNIPTMRGGGALNDFGDDDDSCNEFEKNDDEGDDKVPKATSNKVTYDHSIIDMPPYSSLSSRRQFQQPRRKRKKLPHWSQRLATSSIQMTGQLAWNTLIKQPSKLAYHVIRPKHVDIRETNGLWRLEQQVTERGGREVASVATIEFHSRLRQVILRKEEHLQIQSSEGKNGMPKIITIKEPYTFTKTKLTGSFQSQFVAPAFLIGENQVRLYGYRGTWQRKLADKRVIKLVGKIYQVHKQRFGKHRGEYVFGQAVGTFVARRRIKARVEEDEIEDVEEYDDDDDVDEENWDDDEEEGYDGDEEEMDET